MPASADRNLLFGILALQLDFVTKDALVGAMHAWVGVPEYAIDLGACYVNLGNSLGRQHMPAAALEWHAKAIECLHVVVVKEPRLVKARQYLRNAHMGRATDLMKFQRYAEALSDWDRAIELDDGPLRISSQLDRADCLARLGRTEEATAAAEQCASGKDANSGQIYDCSCIVSLSSAGPNNADADAHAAHAVILLRQAIAKGYSDIPHLMNDADLAALRKREDYAALLWDLADMPSKP